ncbi:MAG: WD40/YVTN/BNR-like repeat-containing protein [Pseudanabaena sp.]
MTTATNTRISLQQFARPEVKTSLQTADSLWLGTKVGLFRYDISNGSLEAIARWQNCEIKCLATAEAGLYLLAKEEEILTIHRCDQIGNAIGAIALPEGDETKSLAVLDNQVWMGGKCGIYYYSAEAWGKVYGEGKCEVTRLWQQGDRWLAAVKKLAPEETPALLISEDQGQTWQVQWRGFYGDKIVAATADQIATVWSGLRPIGMAGKLSKEPVQAIAVDCSRSQNQFQATVQGHKLKLHPESANGATIEVKHPVFGGELSGLFLRDRQVFVTAGHGAFAIDLVSGEVSDLFAQTQFTEPVGKVKKLFPLAESGSFIANASFGTFRSLDGGESWQSVQTDWAALRLEAVVSDRQGKLWAGCQDGIFTSEDQGASWKHFKFSTEPHYGELHSLSFAGDRLIIASANGVFVSEPHEPKHLQQVSAIGDRKCKQVIVQSDRLVTAVAEHGLIFSFNPEDLDAGITEITLDIPELMELKKVLIDPDGSLVAISKFQIHKQNNGTWTEISPAMPVGGWHYAMSASGLLVWDMMQAWFRSPASLTWQPVPNWIEGIKQGAVSDRGYALATDRHYIYRVEME